MPAELDRCVRKVSAKDGVDDPWAVCIASTGWKRKKGGGWSKSKKKSAITEASKHKR